MDKNILVTGGTGFIGSHTIVELINSGYKNITIIDDLSNSKIDILDKIKQITGIKPDFYQIDITNYLSLKELFYGKRFDIVFHFAGKKSVRESIEKPLYYYENNVLGTLNLLNCMKEYNINNLIFSSTATVYGESNVGELKETMITGQKITNTYSQTKYVIEKMIEEYGLSNKDFSSVVLRYFNPIGAHPSGLIGEDPNDIPNNLMPIISNVYRGKSNKLKIFGKDYPTRDGTCIRDYIHVVDLAKGHLNAIKGLEAGKVKVYNLGTGKGISVLELVNTFNKISDKKVNYIFSDRRPGDMAEYYANSNKALKELGWKTELSIEDTIKDILNFIKGDQF